ncbi:uncharacterized protein METZ01_LOCUS451976, partial [marine metagenome]
MNGSSDSYECSIYGHAEIPIMIDENLSYEDTLTVLQTYLSGYDNVHDATHHCENN